MNQLDQFIAHRLKGRFVYWQRYVDDLLFLGTDPQALRSLIPEIQDFLTHHLKMTLNFKKTRLQPLARGLDHLGYWHKPDHMLVRQRVVTNCKARIKALAVRDAGHVSVAALAAAFNSYLGYFRQAASSRLRHGIAARVVRLAGHDGVLMADTSCTKLLPVKDSTAQAAHAGREKVRRREFCESFVVGRDDPLRQKKVMKYLREWHDLDDLMEARGGAVSCLPREPC